MNQENSSIFDPTERQISRGFEIPQSLLSELVSFPEPVGASYCAEYNSFLLTDEKANFLVAIVQGESAVEFDDESLAWVPLHAWRILLHKKYEPAIPALISRLTFDDDDDWAHEDIHHGLKAMGPVVLDPIFKELREATIFAQNAFGFASLVEVVSDIAKIEPSYRERVTKFLRELLVNFETFPPRFNAFVASASAELADVEAALLIQKVYERQFIDEEIADWSWICEKMPIGSVPATVKKNAYKLNEFQYNGDPNFQRVLKSLGASTNVHELKCFLVGVLLAVDMVQPSRILSEIIDDAEEENGGFQSEGQTLYFYREFFGLWNELSNYQDRIFPLPEVDLRLIEGESDESVIVLKVFWIKLHLGAFIRGLTMGNTDEERFAGTFIGSFIESIEEKLTELDQLEDNNQLTSEAVDFHLAGIRTYWQENYLRFAKACGDTRKKKMERTIFLQENQHVGRNDPCPCGSGKKFKKCCMMED